MSRCRRFCRPPAWAWVLAFGFWTLSLAWAIAALWATTPVEAMWFVIGAAGLSIIGWGLWAWDGTLEDSEVSGSAAVALTPGDTSPAADPDFDSRSRGLVVPRSAMRAPRPATEPHSGSRSGHSFGGGS